MRAGNRIIGTQWQPSSPNHTQALSLLEGPAHGVASRAIALAYTTAVLHGTRVNLKVAAHILKQRGGPLCWLPAPSGYPPGSRRETLGGGQEPLLGSSPITVILPDTHELLFP